MNPLLFRLLRAREVRLHELNYLFWECTTRCNLRCRHCGSDCTRASREADLPLEDFLGALSTVPEALRRSGHFSVVLTGGEPLMRPDLAEAGRRIRALGPGWGMVSNGYFYDEKKQDELLRAGLGALTVSLDGLEEAHDGMRGVPGSFARAVKAISLAAGVPSLAFDVVTCVTPATLGSLPQIYTLLEGLGVERWRLFAVIPIGRASPDLLLSGEQRRALMDYIRDTRAHPPGRLRVSYSCQSYTGPRYEEKVRDGRFFCHAGVNIASVLIDGRICACPDIDRERFSQGSIYTDSLWDVWLTRFGPYRDRSWAKQGNCASCKQWRNCLGGGMHAWRLGADAPLECMFR